MFRYLVALLFMQPSFSFAANFVTQRTPFFSVDSNVVKSNQTQLFLKYQRENNLTSEEKAIHTKLFGFNKKGPLGKSILLGKSATLVNRPIDFFSLDRLFSADFIERSLKDTEVLNIHLPTVDVMKRAGWGPIKKKFYFSYDMYMVRSVDPEWEQMGEVHLWDKTLGAPDFILIQNMYNYTNFFVSSVILTKYYKIENKTLIVTYQSTIVDHERIVSQVPFFFSIQNQIIKGAKKELAHLIDSVN